MAHLFDRDRKTITRHISNIFKEQELQKNSVCSYFEHTAKDGKKYKTQYYNLDVIISVGHRVKSRRGTQFRVWATKILKQYLLSGYAINESRMKAIEERLNTLPKQIKKEILTQIDDKINDKIQDFYRIGMQISNRPIKIYNKIGLASNELEQRLINLLDKIIDKTKDNKKISSDLGIVKDIIQSPSKDEDSKNKLIGFLKDLGDNNSNLNKAIKGAGITGSIIKELVKLGSKLKDLLF